MLNQITLVGKIVELKEEKESTVIKIEVKRKFKNSEGKYDCDIIPIVLLETIAERTNDWFNIDDIVGIKGHIQTKDNNIIIICERLTFLSSKSRE